MQTGHQKITLIPCVNCGTWSVNLFLVYAVIKDVIKSSYPRWLKRVFVSNKNIYVLLAFDSITEIQEAFKKLTKKSPLVFLSELTLISQCFMLWMFYSQVLIGAAYSTNWILDVLYASIAFYKRGTRKELWAMVNASHVIAADLECHTDLQLRMSMFVKIYNMAKKLMLKNRCGAIITP